MVKAGDIVQYSIHGKEKLAMVLFAHTGNANHLGALGEPLLHLAFIAPERESERVRTNPGYVPEIFIEYDVHHVSHEFSEEYKRQHGISTPAQIASRRVSAGFWQEVAVLLPEAHTALVTRLEGVGQILRDERAAHGETKAKLAAAEAALPKPPVVEHEDELPAETHSDSQE